MQLTHHLPVAPRTDVQGAIDLAQMELQSTHEQRLALAPDAARMRLLADAAYSAEAKVSAGYVSANIFRRCKT